LAACFWVGEDTAWGGLLARLNVVFAMLVVAAPPVVDFGDS
jgi:hypothetical protein